MLKDKIEKKLKKEKKIKLTGQTRDMDNKTDNLTKPIEKKNY